MLVTDQTASQLDAASPERPGIPSSALAAVPLSSTGHHGQVPGAEDVASYSSAAQAWAAESGLTMLEFQRTYFEQRVTEFVDQYPALRRHDAECLALTEEPWLDDRAA